jgi:hypothetical protein
MKDKIMNWHVEQNKDGSKCTITCDSGKTERVIKSMNQETNQAGKPTCFSGWVIHEKCGFEKLGNIKELIEKKYPGIKRGYWV